VVKNKEEQQPVAKPTITFGYFKQEVEKNEEGVRAMLAPEIGNPRANLSGSYNLDYDLVIPFPEGRITEVFGEEGTCKTTLTLEVAGRALQAGKIVLYVNMEKNLNLSLMQTVRTLRPFLERAIENMEAVAANKKAPHAECPFWIVNASNGEQAFETIRKFASMVPGGIAILDSIDASQPSAVLAGVIGENKVGNLSKLISDAMRKLIDVAEMNKVALIFVNQVRDKITMYGDPMTTSGGRGLPFYASQRIKLQKPGKAQMIVDASGEKIGVLIRYKVVKNKVAPDGSEGEFPILFHNGVFREQELVSKCCHFGVLKMGGKGGSQVHMPKLDRDTGEFVMKPKTKKDDKDELDTTSMSQFNAARRLLIDSALREKLDKELQKILPSAKRDPVDGMTDEIQDTE
jgi:recombination protein RecA